MRRLALFAALIIMQLCGAAAHAAAKPGGDSGLERWDDSVRALVQRGAPLLRISRGGFSAYVLGEAHTGYPGQFQAHFRSVVLPAARRSSTLVREDALLDTWPGSPHWGRSCLDEHQGLAALGAPIVERIVTHHRHSQWADLKRAFSQQPETSSDVHFSTFIGSRGLMINFIELDFRVRGAVQHEWAIKLSSNPRGTAREYSREFGAAKRILRLVPSLKNESIETYDDFAWALCALDPDTREAAFRDTVTLLDATETQVRRWRPGSFYKELGLLFAALQAQLDPPKAGFPPSLAPLVDPQGRMRSEAIQRLLPTIGESPALDKFWLGMRNERWAQRIDEHAAAQRSGLFYVFGAAHLLDYEHFDSVLSLLRKRGFEISLVRPGGRLTPLTRPSSNTSPPPSPSSSAPSTGTRR